MNGRIVNQIGHGHGADYFADTTAHTGRWQAITALEASVVALVASDVGGSSLAAVPVPAGATIYGTFSSVTLASGKVWASRLA